MKEYIKDCYRRHFNLFIIDRLTRKPPIAISGSSSGYIGWDLMRDKHGIGYRNICSVDNNFEVLLKWLKK